MPGPQPKVLESGLESLIVSLHGARGKVTDHDIAFLTDTLGNKQFQALVKLHLKLSDANQIPNPVTINSSRILNEVIDVLLCSEKSSSDISQLLAILSNSDLKSLLEVHDCIAAKDYEPSLPEIPFEVDEDEETVKIVQLVKSNEPLGATIKCDERTGKIFIARVMHGGAADRSGLIHVGDEVHEVNGINVYGRTPNDVVKILKSINGTIVFKLMPAEDDDDGKFESKVRVRAHFCYDPSHDNQIPCKEAGLAFEKGDILHIVNQDDPNWWQARVEDDRSLRAGLIPGKQLQERRIASIRESKKANAHMSWDDSVCEFQSSDCHASPFCGMNSPTKGRQHKNVKKVMYDTQDFIDYEREELPTYEEVTRLYPRLGLFQPIVLIGPPGVGRNELKRRLMAANSNLYKTTIPYTSRSKREYEVDGQEYNFVDREDMEIGISQGEFVEYGEYKGNLYGTSLESVKSIINAGYIGIMNPHPQALKMLRTPEIKPYVIFIKPPDLEVLKETRFSTNARSTFDETSQRGFTDDEFRDMLLSAHKIECLYGHAFDKVIINDNLAEAFEELYVTVKKLETEPQWVPASWVI